MFATVLCLTLCSLCIDTGVNFVSFLWREKKLQRNLGAFFYLAFSSWVALSSFLKEDGVVLTDAAL